MLPGHLTTLLQGLKSITIHRL